KYSEASNHFLLPVNHAEIAAEEGYDPNPARIEWLDGSQLNVSVMVLIPSRKYNILDAIAKPAWAVLRAMKSLLPKSPKGNHDLSALVNFPPCPSEEFATDDANSFCG